MSGLYRTISRNVSKLQTLDVSSDTCSVCKVLTPDPPELVIERAFNTAKMYLTVFKDYTPEGWSLTTIYRPHKDGSGMSMQYLTLCDKCSNNVLGETLKLAYPTPKGHH